MHAGRIGRLELPARKFTFYELVPETCGPAVVTAGPDGAVWFCRTRDDLLGRITPDGALTECDLPTPSSEPHGRTQGPDGAIWTALESGVLARVTIAGEG